MSSLMHLWFSQVLDGLLKEILVFKGKVQTLCDKHGMLIFLILWYFSTYNKILAIMGLLTRFTSLPFVEWLIYLLMTMIDGKFTINSF